MKQASYKQKNILSRLLSQSTCQDILLSTQLESNTPP